MTRRTHINFWKDPNNDDQYVVRRKTKPIGMMVKEFDPPIGRHDPSIGAIRKIHVWKFKGRGNRGGFAPLVYKAWYDSAAYQKLLAWPDAVQPDRIDVNPWFPAPAVDSRNAAQKIGTGGRKWKHILIGAPEPVLKGHMQAESEMARQAAIAGAASNAAREAVKSLWRSQPDDRGLPGIFSHLSDKHLAALADKLWDERPPAERQQIIDDFFPRTESLLEAEEAMNAAAKRARDRRRGRGPFGKPISSQDLSRPPEPRENFLSQLTKSVIDKSRKFR